MPIPLVSTLFALGVYLGNPNGSDSWAEQAFEQSYASFTSTMGATPVYILNYIDNSQTPDAWVGSAGWQAWSNAQSPVARNLVPVISLQLSSTNGNAGPLLQQLQAFADGSNDYIASEIVDVWNNNGFTKLVFRLGAEMNIESLGYAGDDPTTQAMWVKAFKRISNVLRNEGKAHNMSVQVMWNPDTTNYSNAHATTALYPGDAYVDIIGADMYADMYPYNDTFNPDTYHDWDTGGEDYSIPQFVADYINGEHYWSWPAANINCLDCSGGHSQSLDSLIAFALQHRKPFAIPETGAGNSWNGHDTNDQSAFPMWLAQELTTAQAAGLQIAFVAIWDSNGGGNYEYSYTSDGKPNELASWSKYFGAQPRRTGLVGMPVVVGTGTDTLQFDVSEDAWQGDAEFTVSIDGQQVSQTFEAAASYAAGKRQAYVLHGNWGKSGHSITINFLNDANNGTAATDRNLYVSGLSYDGLKPSRGNLHLLAGGPQTVTVVAATSASDTSRKTEGVP